MKKLLVTLLSLCCLTGCMDNNSMEGINIKTTIYPIEYIVKQLYGNHSTVSSIYPDGVNVQIEKCEDCGNTLYTLTDKELSDYSKTNLFVFNSLLYEGNYVQTMFESNKKLKIINATDHLTINDYYGLEELWLDPSRLLTLSRNIKNGFNEYIDNYYLNQEIEKNFANLKEDLDKLASKLADITKNAKNKNIVVGNDIFKFLSNDKYGLQVYSLEETDNLTKKTISDVKTLIENGTIKYIFIKQYDEINNTIKQLINGTDIKVIQLHTLVNLTETERSNKKDYFTIMNENIDALNKALN